MLILELNAVGCSVEEAYKMSGRFNRHDPGPLIAAEQKWCMFYPMNIHG
ncbi:hypothetical protein GSbR_31980 [Geobacter sp. SVR]|nr:hypothetical protein GSVR_04510 [Geobacter sp. SVR]GCF86598.1 hypothetical protein GSbR_31980 [Geobacter sp. SVR]